MPEKEDTSYRTCGSLLMLVKQRLQLVLRTLVKLCTAKPPAMKECPTLAETYRACYVCSFRLKDGLGFYEVVEVLRGVLEEISTKVDEAKKVMN